MERYLIGIDIGTTGAKSMLISETGRIVAHAYAGYELRTPGTGMTEQDAEDWWRALVKTVRAITSDPVLARGVVAISLSLQGGTMVPVDAQGNPVDYAVVWSDKRCEAQRLAFTKRFGDDYLYNKSGWEMGRGLNALQIAWFRENKPELFARTAKFLSVPDYISLRMTGHAVIDISDVGINQLADIRKSRYDEGILDFAGIREDQLPEILPSAVPVGKLLPAVALELRLPKNVLLVTGAHDQYAALLGAGITSAGDVLIGTGTAWVVTALSDEPNFATGFSQSISATKKWGSMISISTGGVCLDWFRNGIASSEKEGGLNYSRINEVAACRPIGGDGLFFFPYFNGAITPLTNLGVKASFMGLDLSHDRYDMARAVMEGVAMQSAWSLEQFREKFPIRSLKLAGGASKSALWTQMVADINNNVVKTPGVNDLACVGAAIMAGVGSGIFASCDEGVSRVALDEREYTPIPENVEAYARHFAAYKRRAYALSQMEE